MSGSAGPLFGPLQSALAGFAGALGERLPALIASGVALLLTWWLSGFARNASRKIMARTSTAGHVDVLVSHIVQATVAVVGVVFALGIAGVNVAALVASLGIVGLTIGLALKDVLANYVAGILLLIQAPFTLGDTILVGGSEGVVIDVDARATVLRAPDGKTTYIPNSTVFGSIVTNASSEPVRRFEVIVAVPEGVDALTACRIAVQGIAAIEGVVSEPVPDATIAIGEGPQPRVTAHGWVDTGSDSLGEVANRAYSRIVNLIAEAGGLPEGAAS